MIDTLLIATDGSERSSNAVDHALDLAAAFGATVHAVYVVETSGSYILSVGVSEEQLDTNRRYGEAVADDVVARAEERGLEGVGAVRTGTVAEEIVEYAAESDADVVVMAERGRGTLEQYLGSSTESVVRMCDRPVTVVRS
jgi:nucleotide-binding universal stress UspA family protein